MPADPDLVNAAWVIAFAPESIRRRVANGWHPVMHERVVPPCWNKDGEASEDLTADEVAWFEGRQTDG